MKQNFTFLLILITTSLFSQSNFESGYYIDNNDVKHSGFIYNTDWKFNPTSITFKNNSSDKGSKIDISELKEFTITGISEYKRFTVDVDKSLNSLESISKQKDPEYINETVLLQTITKGDISLLRLDQPGTINFYLLKEEDNQPTPLVYKQYQVKSRVVAKNNHYKQQLLNTLNCNSLNTTTFEKLDYSERKLKDLFNKYYKCTNQTVVKEDKSNHRDEINLSIRPAYFNSSYDVSGFTTQTEKNGEFESHSGFQIGLEFEYILPFFNNKMGIMLEPQYRSYEFVKNGEIAQGRAILKHSVIDLSFGFRYYSYINDSSKLFYNLNYHTNIKGGSGDILDYESGRDFDVSNSGSFAAGIGYNYNSKYSLEVRYEFERNFLSNKGVQEESKTLFVILGYNLF